MQLIILIAYTFHIISFASLSQNRGFDYSIFENLLQKFVNEDGLVDYEGFRQSKDFSNYLDLISAYDVSNLEINEKLSFYINAYNALTIKNVLINYPINSPRDVKGFFNEKKFKVAGNYLALDELEHKYIIPLNNILPNFGLVCAALSCPKLIRKVYNSETVFKQLEANAEAFLNDKSKNRLDRESGILFLSEIFKWFKKDFEAEFGSLKEAVLYFINTGDKKFLEENDVEIKFIQYNWQLNAQ